MRTVVGNSVYLDEIVTFESGSAYACRFRRSDGASLVRAVSGSGETQVVTLQGAGDMPEVDNLAFFGPDSEESFACTVKGVEVIEDFTARLTLVDHAPEIEQLVDAEAPPPWSGRSGSEAQANTDVPVAPIVTGVASGREAASVATDAVPYPVVVSLQPNPAGTVAIVTYEVQSRIIGTTTFASATAEAGSGAVLLPGYAKGDDIEFKARGISGLGTLGEFTVLMTQILVADGTGAAFSTASPYRDPVASGPNVPLVVDLILDPGPYSIFVASLDNNAPPVASIPRGPVSVIVV